MASNIIGRVDLNLSQRKVGRLGVLKNRLTPTRGLSKVCTQLSFAATHQEITIGVSSGPWSFKSTLYISDQTVISGKVRREKEPTYVLGSKYVAKILAKAGVTSFIIPRGSSEKEIGRLLNALMDRGVD